MFSLIREKGGGGGGGGGGGRGYPTPDGLTRATICGSMGLDTSDAE
jgi:hypothetical protein